jgi:hypothetical protein
MTISVLLAVLSTAALVGVWGILFGLIAEDRFVRARGWAIAALALAVGIAEVDTDLVATDRPAL